MWSLGCIIAELYSGRPLFPGTDENEMIEFVALVCGNIPQSMIDRGKKKDKFFNVNNSYRIIRSKKSRLLSLSKGSISLN
jgi:dual specificity tyrosine-phosphorylation-regulated kinase 2/3/4